MRNLMHLTAFIITFSVMSIGVAHATLLSDHFGVTLLLDTANSYTDTYQGTTSYPMLQSSFTPTLNTSTVNWIADDWWGSWSTTHITAHVTDPDSGQYPSGSEPYDVEALYFDNDDTNLYIAVVTSFPPFGITDSRYYDMFVGPGDLALDFGINDPYSDGFSYDYGINIGNEIRQTDAAENAAAAEIPAVGNELYRTANSDWYTATPEGAVKAGGEHTNFDPNFSSFSGTLLGAAMVDYYEYTFADGLEETLYPTYIVEVTIPISYFPELVNGQKIGVSFIEGCRNDGNELDANIRLYGTTSMPEPTTLALLSMGLAGLIAARRRRNSKIEA